MTDNPYRIVLHFTGDASVPPVRVRGTQFLMNTIGDAICVVMQSTEADQLAQSFNIRTIRTPIVDDTIHEIINALPCLRRGDILYISTEPDHIRAYRSARILLAFKGVRVLDCTNFSDRGSYREPIWNKVRDVFRAVWYRFTLKYPPRLR